MVITFEFPLPGDKRGERNSGNKTDSLVFPRGRRCERRGRGASATFANRSRINSMLPDFIIPISPFDLDAMSDIGRFISASVRSPREPKNSNELHEFPAGQKINA